MYHLHSFVKNNESRIYTGSTQDLSFRLQTHRREIRLQKKKYKKNWRKTQIVWFEIFKTRKEAYHREFIFKQSYKNFYDSSEKNLTINTIKSMIKHNQKLDLFDKIINRESLISQKNNCNIKHKYNIGILFS
tara:strand:- start:849 stop:1244 length:396 start_codon:yes stop_codon:yes gene_type:complete